MVGHSTLPAGRIEPPESIHQFIADALKIADGDGIGFVGTNDPYTPTGFPLYETRPQAKALLQNAKPVTPGTFTAASAKSISRRSCPTSVLKSKSLNPYMLNALGIERFK